MPRTGGSPARPVTTGVETGTTPAVSAPAGPVTTGVETGTPPTGSAPARPVKTGVETGTSPAGSAPAGPVMTGLELELEGDSNFLSVLEVLKLQRKHLGILRKSV